MLKKCKKLVGILILLLLLFTLPYSVLALDDDEFSGYAADTLTIKVGYFGGPYYEKHIFTLNELDSMDKVYADYTFIDNMPSVVIDHVEGVRLSDLMDAAGIDLGSVQNFYFWTKDKTSSYYTSFPKTELIDTPRYCYYSLPDNFDYDTKSGNENATSDGQLVDTVIALGDDWQRCIAGATFGSDYMNLNSNTRFRLIYGQTDAIVNTASRSAKWIHAIVVELGGAPTITMDSSVLDLEVGSLFRTQASISSADSVISENAEITWSSSDESIASVDNKGNITVHKEGTAVITASFMDSKASVTVNGKAGEASQPMGDVSSTQATEEQTEKGQIDKEQAEKEQTDKEQTDKEQTDKEQTDKEQTDKEQIDNRQADKEQTEKEQAVVELKSDEQVIQGKAVDGHLTPVPDDGLQKIGISEVIKNESDGTEQYNIKESQVMSENDKGGIQNWRIYEMSKAAVELPIIEEDNPLMPVIGVITVLLILGGAIFKIIKFKLDMGEKVYISIQKDK